MADHVRRQIRETVAGLLAGLPLTGDNVFASRVYHLEPANLPALLVYSESESSTPLGIGTPRQLDRLLQIRVEAYAQVTVDLDNALDAICLQVETALANPVGPLVSLARTITLISTEIALEAVADQPCGRATMTFEVEYFTAENAPDAAL